jgi:two-component system nitrogen regulation sensor histidine kinase NtrY
MTFRKRLLVLVALTVIVTVGLASWVVSVTTERAFELLDNQRTQALVGQFRREFARRGDEIVRTVEGIASAESTLRIAIDLRRRMPDYSPYVNQAGELATAHSLEFLEIVADDGTIVSSAQWPARFGYQAGWVNRKAGWGGEGAFLKSEELPNETALALVAVRSVSAGEKKLYIVGGRRLDKEFLASLVLPAGMRVLLYCNFGPEFSAQALTDASGLVPEAQMLAPLVERVQKERREVNQTIRWSHGPETFQAIPLNGRENNLLGVLLVGRSRRELVALVNRIRSTGALVGSVGILLGVFLSYWVSARVTHPVERLASGARQVAEGNWEASVDVRSEDEIGELARAFNHMTQQLIEQRDRLVQAERVAAWRELARRLAHELKNPLFPLQITIENLQRAREKAPEQFEEVFKESTTTLLAELANLKAIIGRFSDFAKMPPPQLEPVDLNEVVRRAVKLFDAQLGAEGRPPVTPKLDLAGDAGSIQADSQQLSRALQNLILNAIDAMPKGGNLTIRTSRHNSLVRLEVSDTGEGLTKEECERLFTPYYTTKQHGTGLGLAIVQSVVSDHNGRITVESEQGRGTTFCIELPEAG